MYIKIVFKQFAGKKDNELFLCFYFQKEMQNIDAAFYYLANEFHKLFQDRLETFKSLS